MSLFRNLAGWALGLALLGAVAVAQSDDTPLGDVARQQPVKKATKTFDEENFKSSVPARAPATDAKTSDSAKPAGDTGEAKTADKADAAPDDDVKALEKELAELKERRDITSNQIARLESSMQNAEGDTRDSLAENQAIFKERLKGLNEQIPVLEKRLAAARAAQKSDSGEQGEGGETAKPAESKPEESAPPKSP